MSEPTDDDGLPTVADISSRLADVRERIEAARSDGQHVEIVAVTKTFPTELARRAVAAGLSQMGENYAQDLRAKADDLAELDPAAAETVRWHFIGGLQRNKIKLLAGTVSLWHTIDRAALVTELAKRCPGSSMLIQVNTTDEDQKSGCRPADAAGLVAQARDAGLDVRGLMTIGPTDGSSPAPAFASLRTLAESLELTELSMGMSGDFEIAVRQGATMIRIGSTLFGRRRDQGFRLPDHAPPEPRDGVESSPRSV